jgi:hypothetical protein
VDYVRVLRLVAAMLAELGAPFAVAGGWAMNSYGRARATFDLDLVVPREIQDRLVERLEALGYETLAPGDSRSSPTFEHCYACRAWTRAPFADTSSVTD